MKRFSNQGRLRGAIHSLRRRIRQETIGMAGILRSSGNCSCAHVLLGWPYPYQVCMLTILCTHHKIHPLICLLQGCMVHCWYCWWSVNRCRHRSKWQVLIHGRTFGYGFGRGVHVIDRFSIFTSYYSSRRWSVLHCPVRWTCSLQWIFALWHSKNCLPCWKPSQLRLWCAKIWPGQ